MYIVSTNFSSVNCYSINTVNVLKFQTLFSFCSQIKCCLSGLEFTIANREDPDQTASSEAVWSGSVLFVLAFLTGNDCSKFKNIYRNKYRVTTSYLRTILKKFFFQLNRPEKLNGIKYINDMQDRTNIIWASTYYFGINWISADFGEPAH